VTSSQKDAKTDFLRKITKGEIASKPNPPYLTQVVAHCRFINADEDESRRGQERTVTVNSAVTGGRLKLTSL
jgi:hypothetical protein